MDQFMKRAVELAIENVHDGGQPYGAVVVKDGKIVAEAVNTMHKEFDISGHAELVAVRALQKELKTNDLSGYVMYASGAPCEMCQVAMFNVGIRDVYFGQSLDEVVDAGFDEDVTTEDEVKQFVDSMKQIPLGSDVEDPIQLYAKREGR